MKAVCSFTRGRAPFGQHQESRPLAGSNDIPVLNGFIRTIDLDLKQPDLSDLTLSVRRVMGRPWIVDFRCWTWPEVAILGADQKERGLWGRECTRIPTKSIFFFYSRYQHIVEEKYNNTRGIDFPSKMKKKT